MRKTSHKLFTIFGTLAFIALTAVPALAVAQQQGSSNSSTGNGSDASQSQGSTGSGNSDENSQGNRLQGDSLARCQNKEARINQLMQRITNRARLQYRLFETITQRVQTYYTENDLLVSNYDELVATVEAARVQAQNTFQAMETNGGDFVCDGEDPHAYTNQFRNSFNSANQDLVAYKNAVRNLVVAVQTAAQEANNE